MVDRPKAELLAYLADCRSRGEKIGLLEFTHLCRLMTASLMADKRWKDKARLSRERGYSETGEALPENILEHTGFDTPFLGAIMLATERKLGTRLNYELHMLNFLIHDWPEGLVLKGDVDFDRKTAKEDEEESAVFNLFLNVLDGDAKEYLSLAYAITEEAGLAKRGGEKVSDLSLDAQFFSAVEYSGYVSRALFEVKAGNMIFGRAVVSYIPICEYFFSKFASVRKLLAPVLPYMRKFRHDNKDAEWWK